MTNVLCATAFDALLKETLLSQTVSKGLPEQPGYYWEKYFKYYYYIFFCIALMAHVYQQTSLRFFFTFWKPFTRHFWLSYLSPEGLAPTTPNKNKLSKAKVIFFKGLYTLGWNLKWIKYPFFIAYFFSFSFSYSSLFLKQM